MKERCLTSRTTEKSNAASGGLRQKTPSTRRRRRRPWLRHERGGQRPLANREPIASTNLDKAIARGRRRAETRPEDFRSGRVGPWAWRSERYIGRSRDLVRSVARWFPSLDRLVVRSQEIQSHSQKISAASADRGAEWRSRRKEVRRSLRAQATN